MKINIHKIGFTSSVIILMVLVGAIVSCNKESYDISVTNNANNVSTLPKESSLVLGTYDESSKSFCLNFDKEIFMVQYQQILIDSGLVDLVVENISIEDENPMGDTNKSVFRISVFDTATAEAQSLFLLTDKTINGNTVTYTTNRAGGHFVVHCNGKNCNNGCWINNDRTGCTACNGGPDSYCKQRAVYRTSSGNEIDAADLIGWGIGLLGIIIT